MRYNFLLLTSILFSSCDYFQPKADENKVVIASVDNVNLYKESITGLIPTNTSPKDSVTFVQKFIDDWVKKQLMISQAKQAVDFNEAEIQQKVLEYQYALMVHTFEKQYIDLHIDTDVSPYEIKDYYDEKFENFVLRQNLAKCLYFKIPTSSPNIRRFRRYLKNYPEDSLEVIDYSNQFAIRSYLDQNTWVKFDEVLLETPLKDINDKTNFLRTNSSIETSDEDYLYFLKIFEFKVIGEVAPIEFVEENIVDIIINKRKIELVKELEKNIYEEAKASNAFEIYTY